MKNGQSSSKTHAASQQYPEMAMQNNDPKSENKALKERATRTKSVEGRLKGMVRDQMRPREKDAGRFPSEVAKSAQ